MRFRHFISSCFVGAMCLSVPTVGRAQSDIRIGGPVPEQVKQDWHDRRERCQTLHWKIEMREMLSRALLNEFADEPPEEGQDLKGDINRTRGGEVWIDFGTGKVRSEKYGETQRGKTELTTYHKAKLFDGEVIQRIEDNDLNPDRSPDATEIIEDTPHGRYAKFFFEACDQPLFWNIGMFSMGNLTTAFSRDRANLFDEAKISAYDIENRIVTLRFPERGNSYADFDLDLTKQSAVLRMVSYTKDDQVTSTTEVDWTLQDGNWQPESWKKSSVDPKTGALQVSSDCVAEVIECGVDLSAVLFHITPSAGETYYAAQDKQTYVKSASGADIPVELHRIQQNAASVRWRWIVTLSVIATSLGFAAWWGRRKGVL